MPDLFIGLMSGTSVDAVDGALVDFSGAEPRTLAFASLPMPAPQRRDLLALQQPGTDELARAARATVALTDVYAQVVHELLGKAQVGARDVKAVGAHGQTVRHRPEEGYTLQLMDGARLAEYKLASPAVWDGMAAAHGKLFVSTADGSVLCFAGAQ